MVEELDKDRFDILRFRSRVRSWQRFLQEKTRRSKRTYLDQSKLDLLVEEN